MVLPRARLTFHTTWCRSRRCSHFAVVRGTWWFKCFQKPDEMSQFTVLPNMSQFNTSGERCWLLVMPYAGPSGVDVEEVLRGSNPLKPPVKHDADVLDHPPNMMLVPILDSQRTWARDGVIIQFHIPRDRLNSASQVYGPHCDRNDSHTATCSTGGAGRRSACVYHPGLFVSRAVR